MSSPKVNNADAPRQVTCKTLDNDHILVDLDVLRLSRTFKKMYDDLGLQEHDEFPGVFPVMTVSSCVFRKVIEWCKEHKDAPEPIIEKDPLTQECKWFALTDSEKSFFDVPMPELLELVMAANFLDIPGLLHCACQSVAAGIKGKSPREVCELLRQNYNLDRSRTKKIRKDNPWLSSVFPGVHIENAIFIPNEVLVTIFEKLPREDLERLQLVSTQFDDVIVSSVELSQHQGPLRVVTMVELGVNGSRPKKITVWLRDGTKVACAAPRYKNLAKRLKLAVVEELWAGHGGYYSADVEDLSTLLPVKSTWKNATAYVAMNGFVHKASLEFALTQLLLCEKITLRHGMGYNSRWSPTYAYMHLPAIAECNVLDVSEMKVQDIQPDAVVEWLEHDVPPEKKCSEPRQVILDANRIIGGIEELLTALKTAFLTASTHKPYIVRILRCRDRGIPNEVLTNEKTHERLSVWYIPSKLFLVKRA
ncbi:S-phase kinase-associated protein 1 [Aphelenchoides avenae]|nr:S-phase kinase-associated protein 1 [Aphelenchus avenae]